MESREGTSAKSEDSVQVGSEAGGREKRIHSLSQESDGPDVKRRRHEKRQACGRINVMTVGGSGPIDKVRDGDDEVTMRRDWMSVREHDTMWSQ